MYKNIYLEYITTWTIEEYERVMKIKGPNWIEHKTNERMLYEVNERRTMMNTIMKIKIKLIGHVLRLSEFITIIMDWENKR